MSKVPKLIGRIEGQVQTVAQTIAPRLASRMLDHPMITLVVACVLFYFGLTFGAGFIAGIRHVFEDRAVTELKTEGDKHLEAAGAAGAARANEDANRNTNIRPRIEASTRDLESARERRLKAESNYEKSKHTPLSDLAPGDLHERNCADLRELYPGEPSPYCDL